MGRALWFSDPLFRHRLIGAGLGLVMGGSRLVLGYRGFRESNDELG